jgi:hypothetical protein
LSRPKVCPRCSKQGQTVAIVQVELPLEETVFVCRPCHWDLSSRLKRLGAAVGAVRVRKDGSVAEPPELA